MSRVQSNASDKHYAQARRISRYVKGTRNLGLGYVAGGEDLFEVYSDASFVSTVQRKSTSGCVKFHQGNLVYWKSRAQAVRADSSAIAEYIALYDAIKAANGLLNFYSDLLGTNRDLVPVYCDANAAICMLSTLNTHSCRHIQTKFLYAKEFVEKRFFKVLKVSAEDQIADLLTKPLRTDLFERFVGKILF